MIQSASSKPTRLRHNRGPQPTIFGTGAEQFGHEPLRNFRSANNRAPVMLVH
jgi:hypothetical protein